MRKVILDRTYAYHLIFYLNHLKEEPKGNIGKNIDSAIFQVFNWATILYDKILIEDYYASSLYKLTKNEKWFWNILELYSPDKLMAKEPELEIAIDESIQHDLNDRKLIKSIKKINNGEYKSDIKVDSLIRNINKTLFIAKELNASILPSEHKMKIYNEKFNDSMLFFKNSKNEKVLKTIFEIEVPNFEINTFKELSSLRNDPRIYSLRQLIWKIIEKTQNNDLSVLEELNNEKNKLILELVPKSSGYLKSIISAPIPFPFNIAVDGMFQTQELLRLREHEWLFFLFDLRNNADDK